MQKLSNETDGILSWMKNACNGKVHLTPDCIIITAIQVRFVVPDIGQRKLHGFMGQSFPLFSEKEIVVRSEAVSARNNQEKVKLLLIISSQLKAWNR